MDSVRERRNKKGKLLQWWEFLFCPNEKKWRCCFLPLLILSIFAPNLEVFIFFAKPIIMRFFQVLAFSSLCMLALFGAVSCDDLSAEPKAVPTFTEISPKGGEVTAKIIRRDGGKLTTNWAFERIYTTYNQGDDQTETAVLIDTLADGRVKYAGEWYTFYVSKDKREIKLVLAANKTKVQRSVTFLGQHKASFSMDFDFGAYQKPDTTATN